MIVIAALMIIIPPAFAQNCIETVTCQITNFFDFLIQPFTLLMGDWFYVVVWGLIGGIIYNRSGNVMLVGILGIIIGTSLIGNNIITSSSNSIPILIIMTGAGAGLVLYQLWRNRLNNP